MSRLSVDDSREPSLLARYSVALLASALALLLTWLFQPFMQRNLFLWFFAAIVISAWYGGLGPGLLVTAITCASISYFFIAPFSVFDSGAENLLPLGVFMLVALLISSLTAARRRSAISAQAQRQQLHVTLDSIGDAVIATDVQGCVTRMNAVAETLTGWNSAEALRQPIMGSASLRRRWRNCSSVSTARRMWMSTRSAAWALACSSSKRLLCCTMARSRLTASKARAAPSQFACH